MRIKKLVVAAIASLACIGAVAAPASAGVNNAIAGGWRDATNACLATFPSTCHAVNGPYYAYQEWHPIAGQWGWHLAFSFQGYGGSRLYNCVVDPYEGTYGTFFWWDAAYCQ